MTISRYSKDYYNVNYANLCEMGFDFEYRSNSGGKNRIYLIKDGKRVMHRDYYHNWGKGAYFSHCWPDSHKDCALASMLNELAEMEAEKAEA